MFNVERYNPKKLKATEVREQHPIEVSSKFAALENTDHNMIMSKA
jgi:hypothetical protein